MANNLKAIKYAACDVQFSEVFIDFGGSDFLNNIYEPATVTYENGKKILFDSVTYNSEQSWGLVWESSTSKNKITFANTNDWRLLYIIVDGIGSGTCTKITSGSRDFCFPDDRRVAPTPPNTIKFGSCELKWSRHYAYDWNWGYKSINYYEDCEYMPNLYLQGNRDIVFDSSNPINYPELIVPKYGTIPEKKPYEVIPGVFVAYDSVFYDSGAIRSSQLVRKANLGCGVYANGNEKVVWREGDYRFPKFIENRSYNPRMPIIINDKEISSNSLFLEEKVPGSEEYYVYECDKIYPDSKDECRIKEKLICEK